MPAATAPAHPAADVDVRALERDLAAAVRGEVRFDPGARGAYATDASNFRMPPLGVVVPLDVEDMVAAVAVCRAHGAPLTNRGGGTSLSGETTNTAVVLDSSKHVTRVLELDPVARTVRVEPGALNDDVRAAAAPHGLTFGPDPSTHDRCTIGGNLGNNSCGAHSVMSGRTSDNTVGLDVVLYDGTRLQLRDRYSEDEYWRVVSGGGRPAEVFRALRDIVARYGDLVRECFPRIPRRVSGYNLDALLPENDFNVAASLVGTEGTCVTVLGATLRLVPWPASRTLVLLAFTDVASAADAVPLLLEYAPTAVEGFDDHLVASLRRAGRQARDLSLLPDGRGFLFAELGGADAAESVERARALAAAAGAAAGLVHARVVEDPAAAARLWEVREAALAAAAVVPGKPLMWPGWEDAAVPPARLGGYIRDLHRLYAEFGFLDAALYGHFGDGCLHSRLPFALTSASGVADYRRFCERAADLVVSYGGSLSGEHGDGQQRAELLGRMFGEGLLQAFREFKGVWDPDGRMNPGKVVDPVRVRRLDEDLRLGPDYRPLVARTHFAFADDEGSFDRATLRCVGVGKCRVHGGQTMCPSYMVLRDEEHSTRGRARLLFEMARGEVVTDGWRSREVFRALDMCLSCKGCKRDCPTGVDMATYKAEFLAHHYAGRLRPRSAYAMGLIMLGARAGARAPGLANLALRGPGAGRLTKRLAGVHPRRRVPALATTTFRQWFAARAPAAAGSRRVLLFPDTFTNFFDVDAAAATCRVLESAGFTVALPRRVLCCGRPLFDYGFLGLAGRFYRQILQTLAEDIAAGTPVVVPEPSCAASLRDELVQMLPADPAAQRLSRLVGTLPEVLARHAPDWRPPRPVGRVLVQAHCHERAVFGTEALQRVLQSAGARVELPDAGCCGLAGSWGFEHAKYETSMACGERVLFPAVRAAPEGTELVADGFSCRMQIEQGTGRRARHVAQLLTDEVEVHGAR